VEEIGKKHDRKTEKRREYTEEYIKSLTKTKMAALQISP
jgi:hypothetical protein